MTADNEAPMAAQSKRKQNNKRDPDRWREPEPPPQPALSGLSF